ncbi:hypothetical protein K505DRAFT_330963 [Melanomma pulvis-pyrius CBS 109.77]|uniref:Uncharacterized protein n=1 Tax=Melanomma pulvis-pyrius CBS 109.77 TaxID=1314802 RepID=A0A6A6WN44_9PLEO|nr:hypothetical protein K505DRAFT_330963 [Melanomma pulvis-pyrius CBS 109.77]
MQHLATYPIPSRSVASNPSFEQQPPNKPAHPSPLTFPSPFHPPSHRIRMHPPANPLAHHFSLVLSIPEAIPTQLNSTQRNAMQMPTGAYQPGAVSIHGRPPEPGNGSDGKCGNEKSNNENKKKCEEMIRLLGLRLA